MAYKRIKNDFDLSSYLVENRVTPNSQEIYEDGMSIANRAQDLLDLVNDMRDRGLDSPQQIAQYCREEEPHLCEPEVFMLAQKKTHSDEAYNLIATVFNILHN